jgi:hypothetical protein
MNIPLDNLYHWIRGLASEPITIYTFRTHGSKNITDLTLFDVNNLVAISPEVVCHDQEPLCYQTYQTVSLFDLWMHAKKDHPDQNDLDNPIRTLDPFYQHLNFYAMLRARTIRSVFDRYILLHSEKNSKDVEKFSTVCEPVYYWSHAIISRDWFRFAENDPRLEKKPSCSHTFLVNCRAWTGTREYRLKFVDLLVDANLISNCKISVLHQDQENSIETYQCQNRALQPNNIKNFVDIPDNCFPATASADYDPLEFNKTNISIVLETVADDSKIHLTEKTLRPIACGHPFMLVAGPGSLEYLKSYGFKTFSNWIDESYDQETDTVARMKMIVNEMFRLQSLTQDQKENTWREIQEITEYNKKHFFSDEFYNHVRSELVENLNQAIANVKHTRGQFYLSVRRAIRKHLKKPSDPDNVTQWKLAVAQVLRQLRKDPTTSIKDLINQYPPGFF